MGEVSRDDIEAAAGRIEEHVRRTPVAVLGDVLGSGYRLSLKLDSMQPTGSFKVRGAFSFLTSTVVPDVGVMAASGGNFGLAVAYAAHRLGHKATIFVPQTSPEEKIGKIAGYGAGVRVVDGFYPDALEASLAWGAESGALMAHAYDQHEVVAGQGTCGLEIGEQVADTGSVLVAVGGGGLIGGIASWFRDDVKIVGVESEGCPTLYEARAAGRPVPVEVGGVAASSLGASLLGDHAWEVDRWIDESLLVADEEILRAQRWLWETCRVLSEPAACVTIAALLTGRYRPDPGEHVVAVISGGNTAGLVDGAR
jgi:threonine dehydratase